MPTYDYVCDACKHEFELFQPITASPKRKCPKCGKNKLRRLIGTGAAIMFKGSGFYQTDYRSDSYKQRAEADKPTTANESKSDSKSTDKSGGKSENKTTAASESSSGGKSESKKPGAKKSS